MISFPCACGTHRFNLPDDEAGGFVQCPNCKRLNDVPTLSDLNSIEDDGTLKIADDPKPKKPEPRRIAELHRVYAKAKVDEYGREIDLRQNVDDLRRAGSPERSREDAADDLVDSRPRYDPLTGELVTPLDIKPDNSPPKAVLPIGTSAERAAGLPPLRSSSTSKLGSPPVLGYPSQRPGAAINKEIPSLASLPLRLFEPINLMVMLFVGLMIVVTSGITIPLAGGLFFVAPAVIIGWFLIIAHFANCIDDLGPGGQNDLPRPLRDLEILGDIWRPAIRMGFSVLLCYAPAPVFAAFMTKQPFVQFVGTGVLLAAGAMLFPAVALIMCGSYHSINLRPDRLLGTIKVLGAHYFWLIILCNLAVIFAIGTNVALANVFLVTLVNVASKNLFLFIITSLASLPVALYTAHLACWTLGVLYRRNADTFPWFFQQHERDRAEHKRLKALAQIEASRRHKFAQ